MAAEQNVTPAVKEEYMQLYNTPEKILDNVQIDGLDDKEIGECQFQLDDLFRIMGEKIYAAGRLRGPDGKFKTVDIANELTAANALINRIFGLIDRPKLLELHHHLAALNESARRFGYLAEDLNLALNPKTHRISPVQFQFFDRTFGIITTTEYDECQMTDVMSNIATICSRANINTQQLIVSLMGNPITVSRMRWIMAHTVLVSRVYKPRHTWPAHLIKV
jgi:hypothetical protein